MFGLFSLRGGQNGAGGLDRTDALAGDGPDVLLLIKPLLIKTLLDKAGRPEEPPAPRPEDKKQA